MVNLKFYKKVRGINVILSLLTFKILEIGALHQIKSLKVKMRIFKIWGLVKVRGVAQVF